MTRLLLRGASSGSGSGHCPVPSTESTPRTTLPGRVGRSLSRKAGRGEGAVGVGIAYLPSTSAHTALHRYSTSTTSRFCSRCGTASLPPERSRSSPLPSTAQKRSTISADLTRFSSCFRASSRRTETDERARPTTAATACPVDRRCGVEDVEAALLSRAGRRFLLRPRSGRRAARTGGLRHGPAPIRPRWGLPRRRADRPPDVPPLDHDRPGHPRPRHLGPRRLCRPMLGVGLEHVTRRSARLCRAARCCVERERA